MTTPTDYRVHLTYAQALEKAKALMDASPDAITKHAYFIESAREGRQPHCIVSWIIFGAGFSAPPEWWEAKRHDGIGLYYSASLRYNTHIRFLSDELFSNEDLDRDAFLTTLQSRQDNGTTWAKAVPASERYVTRINLRNPQR